MRIDSLQEFLKLRRELSQEKATLEKRLSVLNAALGEIRQAHTTTTAEIPAAASQEAPGKAGRRTMSPAARARIAAAQKARWAKSRKGQPAKPAQNTPSNNGASKPKRRVSPAAREALAEIARRRWTKAKAAGKNGAVTGAEGYSYGSPR